MEAVTAKKKSTSKNKVPAVTGPETVAFVDWENVIILAEEYGLWVDPIKACIYLRLMLGVDSIYFYCVNHRPISKNSDELGLTALRLKAKGVIVKEKRLGWGFFKKQSQRRRGANLDVDLTIGVTDAMRQSSVKKILLFSGDGDFTSLVIRVQQHRKHNPIQVVAMSWRECAAEDLVKQVNEFLPLDAVVSRMTSPWPKSWKERQNR